MANDPTALVNEMVANVQAITDYPKVGLSPTISDTRTLTAIAQAIVDQLTFPTGIVAPFLGAVAPIGWLILSGQNISRSTYSALFALWGTTYGVGDGSTTFGVPNGAALFFRGTGTQTIGGISYSGPALHATQSDEMQGHHHVMKASGAVASSAGSGVLDWDNVNSGTTTTPDYISDPKTDGVNGTPRTGTETRPVNLGCNFIVKT